MAYVRSFRGADIGGGCGWKLPPETQTQQAIGLLCKVKQMCDLVHLVFVLNVNGLRRGVEHLEMDSWFPVSW